MVWMQESGLSNFRKLYGKINQNLKKGNYTLKLTNDRIFFTKGYEYG